VSNLPSLSLSSYRLSDLRSFHFALLKFNRVYLCDLLFWRCIVGDGISIGVGNGRYLYVA